MNPNRMNTLLMTVRILRETNGKISEEVLLNLASFAFDLMHM